MLLERQREARGADSLGAAWGRKEGDVGLSITARPGWHGVSVLSCRHPHVPRARDGVSVQLEPWHRAHSAGIPIRLGGVRGV